MRTPGRKQLLQFFCRFPQTTDGRLRAGGGWWTGSATRILVSAMIVHAMGHMHDMLWLGRADLGSVLQQEADVSLNPYSQANCIQNNVTPGR